MNKYKYYKNKDNVPRMSCLELGEEWVEIGYGEFMELYMNYTIPEDDIEPEDETDSEEMN